MLQPSIPLMEKIRINNLSVAYRVERRNVRHARIELKTGNLVLIVPHRFADEKQIILKHRDWISRKMKEIGEIRKSASGLRPIATSASMPRAWKISTARGLKASAISTFGINEAPN